MAAVIPANVRAQLVSSEQHDILLHAVQSFQIMAQEIARSVAESLSGNAEFMTLAGQYTALAEFITIDPLRLSPNDYLPSISDLRSSIRSLLDHLGKIANRNVTISAADRTIIDNLGSSNGTSFAEVESIFVNRIEEIERTFSQIVQESASHDSEIQSLLNQNQMLQDQVNQHAHDQPDQNQPDQYQPVQSQPTQNQTALAGTCGANGGRTRHNQPCGRKNRGRCAGH